MSPAFKLLVACCRWPDDSVRQDAIRTAAAHVIDWDPVVGLAERHRVEPLVVQGLEAAGLTIPAALLRVQQQYRALSLRDLMATIGLAAGLDERGIDHRFLKGAPLGVQAYGSPFLKRSWDIDLLVAPAQAVAAADWLIERDYRPITPPRRLDQNEFDRWRRVSKEALFRAPSGSSVELHWATSDHPHLLPQVTAASPARQVALFGEAGVRVLADAENVAYLAVHGTAHAWFRLKWIADFNALLAAFGAARREEVLRAARSLGVGDALDTGLGLARTLFAEEAPPVAPSRLVALSLAALESDEARAETLGRKARMRIVPAPRYALQEIAIRLRGSEDRLHFPLPGHWQRLYPLLRLPLWLIRRVARRGRP